MGVSEQKLLITGICELMSTMNPVDGIKMLQNILLSTLSELNKLIEENHNDIFLISEYFVRISVYIYILYYISIENCYIIYYSISIFSYFKSLY